jgi:hypothetical protein
LGFYPTLDKILSRGKSNDDDIRSSLTISKQLVKEGKYSDAFERLVDAVSMYSDNRDDDISYDRYHLLALVARRVKNKFVQYAAAEKAYSVKNLIDDQDIMETAY